MIYKTIFIITFNIITILGNNLRLFYTMTYLNNIFQELVFRFILFIKIK